MAGANIISYYQRCHRFPRLQTPIEYEFDLHRLRGEGQRKLVMMPPCGRRSIQKPQPERVEGASPMNAHVSVSFSRIHGAALSSGFYYCLPHFFQVLEAPPNRADPFTRDEHRVGPNSAESGFRKLLSSD